MHSKLKAMPRICTLPVLCLLLAVICLPAQAQYESWTAPRLLTEYRHMLENMDGAIKALDKNIAMANTLKQEKQKLDSQSAELDKLSRVLEDDGKQHNAEVATFNAQCIDVQVTDQATGDKCNQWSEQLNTRNSQLSSRRKALNAQIDELNSRVSDYNARETERASEAKDLDSRYDEYEHNLSSIEARLASMKETSDISVRCAGYKQAETRQRCMQQFYNDEH